MLTMFKFYEYYELNDMIVCCECSMLSDDRNNVKLLVAIRSSFFSCVKCSTICTEHSQHEDLEELIIIKIKFHVLSS